ncbi:Helicase associated domain protein [Streptomyces sp. NPDC057963]|uniref:Helicase associated domain protein n=1 Tax=Streptomyces sp. NPDC057963 TaxID=3346290 RepID=UPI0036E2D299
MGSRWPGAWLCETKNGVLRVPYTVVMPEDWGGVGGYPLGQWTSDQRRAYTAGTLEAGRVAEMEPLGMVWSEQEAAWADGVAVPKEYAAARFLPPTTAVWEGHPIGVWAKNTRAAARRARENEELRAAGRPVRSAAGAMAAARQDELDAIDPGWRPVWGTGWQCCYRLVRNHVQAGGTSTMAAPRKYALELHERAMQMYRTSDPKPQIKKLAIDLGVHPEALRGLIRQAEADAGERDDRLSTDEHAELVALRKENAQLKRANEVLPTASAFFAAQLDPTWPR